MTITNGFVNTRLDDSIEQGAEGGPGFLTTILSLASGFEKRNIEWARDRAVWDISYGIQKPEDLDSVRALFRVCHGRGYGFRFKDWLDFVIGDEVNSVPQDFVTGDAVTLKFPIYKIYTADSGDQFFRRITRPVTGTGRVFLNGVEQFTFFTIDYDNGNIEFSGGHAPAMGVQVGIICEFDNPVRFDSDILKLKVTWQEAAEIPPISIVELKEKDL